MELEAMIFCGRHGEQALRMFGLEEELQQWQGLRVWR